MCYLRVWGSYWAQGAMAERFPASGSVLSSHWVMLVWGRCWFPHWGAPRAWTKQEASELCLREGTGRCPPQRWSWRVSERALGASGLLEWCCLWAGFLQPLGELGALGARYRLWACLCPQLARPREAPPYLWQEPSLVPGRSPAGVVSLCSETCISTVVESVPEVTVL